MLFRSGGREEEKEAELERGREVNSTTSHTQLRVVVVEKSHSLTLILRQLGNEGRRRMRKNS